MRGQRCWTLAGARELVGEVRVRTRSRVEEVEKLQAEREALAPTDPAGEAIDARLRDVISRWMREMEALGLDRADLWHVDFDNGRGYFCWKWPEERLEHYHSYEDGFSGRTKIQ